MQNPLINGVAHSFSEVRISVDGVPFTAVKAINYKQSVERGKVRGTSTRVLAHTTGQLDQDGDLEFAEDDYRALIGRFGDGFLKKRFDVVVSYSNDDGVNVDQAQTYTDKLLGCRMKGSEHSGSGGADPLMVKVPLDIMKILEGDANGNFLDGMGSGTP